MGLQRAHLPSSRSVFQVTISCDAQCYKVFVNSIHTCNYNHRYSVLQDVDILEVSGDLSLTSVMV